jgi:hypothetical protein
VSGEHRQPRVGRILLEVSVVLRIVIGLLVAAALAVSIVPALVIMDLNSGGTGWGLCPGGVAECRSSYFAGFELLAIGSLVLFVLLGFIRGAILLLRRVEAQNVKSSADPVSR